MLRVYARLWCLLIAALFVSVCSFRLPDSLHPMLGSDSETGERRAVVKRSSRPIGAFYRLMQRHSRYLDDQAFVEKMFRLFDMNSDNLIERDEFRAMMQLLGFVSHNY